MYLTKYFTPKTDRNTLILLTIVKIQTMESLCSFNKFSLTTGNPAGLALGVWLHIVCSLHVVLYL